MDNEVKVYLFDGSVLRGEMVSQNIRIKQNMWKKREISRNCIKEVSKSTFGFSRKKATIKLVDGSVIKGKLKGKIEIKQSNGEVVKISCKKIFAVKSKKEE